MNQLYLSILATIMGLQLHSQAFRPGYLITNGGARQAIEVDDRDWVDNPNRFRYRGADGAVRHGNTTDVAEFGLTDGSLRYRRFTVAIDSSGDHLSDLAKFPEPLFGDRTVFLEVLVDGEADLFYWEEGERKRFFFRLGDSAAAQLIDRRYLRDDRIIVQHRYLGQLKAALTCDGTDGSIYDLSYTRESLVTFFEAYNACVGSDYTTYERPEREQSVFYWARVGGSRYAGELLSYTSGSVPFERQLVTTYAQSVGLQAEYSVPQAGGRWSMLAGVDYQRIRSTSLQPQIGEAVVESQSICVPLGVRRYLRLSPTGSVFVGVRAIGQFTLDGSVRFRRESNTVSSLDAYWNYQFAGVAGFRHRRFSAALRYGRQLDILRLYDYYASRFTEINLSLSYRIR